MEENEFEAFFKNCPQAYSLFKLVMDDEGVPYDFDLVNINQEYEKLMCVKASEVINKRGSDIFMDAFHVGDWRETVQDSMYNKKTVELEGIYFYNNKWIHFKIFPLNNDLFGCIVFDVTKEYLQEKQIEWFLKNNMDILCVVNYETKNFRINKKFEDAIGYTLDELEGNNPFVLIHEDDLQLTKDAMEKLKHNEPIDRFVNRYRCKDGSLKYFEWHGIYDGNYGYYSACDITQRYKEKAELFIKKQLDIVNMISIVDNLEVGYGRYSYPDYNIIDLNNKAYSILKGVNPNVGNLSSVIGMNGFDIFNCDKKREIRIRNNVKKIEQKKLNHFFENRKINFDGKENYIKILYQPILGLNHEIIEIVSISVDMTEEIKEKNEILKTIKIQEELLVNISHELKTPLNVIFSQNQLMEMYFKNGLFQTNIEKVSEGINIVKQNCYRLTKLINNIVDLSKIKSGFLELNLSNENIVEIIEEIVQSVSEYVRGKGLNITFNSNTKAKIIACDPEKIERIMLNLISNSIKFTNPGGSIYVHLLDKGDIVEILVEDTGIGIEKKDLNKIFGKFQQVDKSLSRNAEGSGIGLSMVKSLTKMHGGKISAESEVGRGSIFRIEFPVRIVENEKNYRKIQRMDNRIQMINVEFSDIYSI